MYADKAGLYGTESLTRFNLFSAVSVYVTPAEGCSSGQAINAVREAADEALPEGYGNEFGGTIYTHKTDHASTPSAIILTAKSQTPATSKHHIQTIKT